MRRRGSGLTRLLVSLLEFVVVAVVVIVIVSVTAVLRVISLIVATRVLGVCPSILTILTKCLLVISRVATVALLILSILREASVLVRLPRHEGSCSRCKGSSPRRERGCTRME